MYVDPRASTWTGRVTFNRTALDRPMRCRRPQAWALWNDLCHPGVTDSDFLATWQMMTRSPRHVFILLTKRPERLEALHRRYCLVWPGHIWPGTSISTQRDADRNLPFLAGIPSAVKVISYEPALGPWQAGSSCLGLVLGHGLPWIIAGGETGGGARPADPEWFRHVRDSCIALGLPFFFKGWGSWAPVASADLSDRVLAQLATCEHPSGAVSYRVGNRKFRSLDGRKWDQCPASPGRAEDF